MSDYAGITQNWVQYHSEPTFEAKNKKFEERIDKKLRAAKTSLRKICTIESNCEPDAQNVAKRWLKGHPLFQFSEYKITTIQRRAEKKRGRPMAGEPMVQIFKIEANIEFNEEAVEKERQKLG